MFIYIYNINLIISYVLHMCALMYVCMYIYMLHESYNSSGFTHMCYYVYIYILKYMGYYEDTLSMNMFHSCRFCSASL